MLKDSLRGIRVADFSQIGAGPTCSMYLGDLGADVVKVEPPSGDIGRMLGPPWVREGESAVFAAFNRNKRSLCLDLKAEDGRQAALELVSSCDVLVESFRPGVMARLGLGYDTVSRVNPRAIYCSVSAYGSSGPLAGKAGVDGIIQAASGLMSLIGEEADAPSKVQAPIVDVATGYIATIAVLASLHERRTSNHGSYLDVPMFAAAIALQQSSVTAYLADGVVPERIGSAAPYSAPNEAFRASDGWIMVAAYQGGRWERLCELMGLGALRDDPQLATSATRVLNRQAMRAALADAFRSRSCAEWLELLSEADILCSKVCDYSDVIDNPQLDHLQLIVGIRADDGDVRKVPGFPVNSRDGAAYRMPPRLGQHTAEVLGEIGYSAARISALVAAGAAHASD